MPDVSLDEIEARTIAALTRHGAAPEVAASVADAVREAEATGNRICGLYYVESYCRQLGTGRVQGQAVPVVTRPRPGLVAVDAAYGFAQPAFAAGFPAALEAARANGVAALTVAHSHTATAMGYFTGQIARAGMVGLGLTNASPTVAAPGGRKRVIGTNPIAFSVPDGQGGVAMQFDFSTSATALGSITMAAEAGEAIPEGWAVDAEGRPTTDPQAALKGALSSAGGYKGWGFGLMAELLAAAMTGSVLSQNVHPLREDSGPPHDFGQFYLLIDPATAPDFAGAFGQIAAAVAADEGARLPGQGRAPRDPVGVPQDLWDTVVALGSG
ncbi:lactate dehydrogenase [Oceanicola sp. 22II-s10i]|uniref:Ldh family oxidoreductase n=1 Tax=Oceanicola sp. 22II-s10i TaxID=1317116 RepID=UPI000B5251A3|nr:Ldh family oxidoreductase [Oceanicola sp. 22II-s10i]OWU84161.1 lactate dehydrogenase [Oceanicola sp. 22II-s10i]